MAKNSGKPVVRTDCQITGLAVIFGNFGIAELFLIGLKLVLEPTRNLELLAQTRQFTKIDGEPIIRAKGTRRSEKLWSGRGDN
jgi:hypothetical protein